MILRWAGYLSVVSFCLWQVIALAAPGDVTTAAGGVFHKYSFAGKGSIKPTRPKDTLHFRYTSGVGGIDVAGKVVTFTFPAATFSGSYLDLTNKPLLFSGAYADLSGKPSLFSGVYADLTGKPTLFSGSYTDLTNKPSIPSAQVNSDWNAESGIAQILNMPAFTRGYDGYDGSQIFTGAGAPSSGTGTASDYYMNTSNGDVYLKEGSPTAWALKGNLKGPAGNNGTNGAVGKNYVCVITGGIRSLLYDKDSHNPVPTMVSFGVELREDGTVVTPASYSWSVPASGSLLSGSSSASVFSPTVNSTFSPASADNRVDVTVTYGSVTCKATAPVPATRIGDTGAQGSPDTKTDIYTKITTAVNGDVLNTQAGSGDADGFAFRTVRAKGGDIHRTDLAVGQTWIHARPTDAATAAKFGIKNSSGTPVIQLNADGSFTGTLVIR